MKWPLTRRKPQISLLVPWREDKLSPQRAVVWSWLQEYWKTELPDAELVIGRYRKRGPFSKTHAVNSAARRARGRIFVILDADCYIRGSVIKYCADQIDEAAGQGRRLWFIPYRWLYRLTPPATSEVLLSDPADPVRFSEPPPAWAVEGTEGSGHGHRFGALIQILPRDAFFYVGGMDERFRGWGGEDVAFLRSVDTLWGHYKTTRNDVLHLWHAKIGTSFETRMWQGQETPGANNQLAGRYNRATGDVARMRKLVDEG